MATVVLGGDTMGPERIFPNQTEELGSHQGPTEGTGDWSSEEPEEEQEETGAGPAGYSYQPLNQDPEPEEVELAPVVDGEDVVADIQDRIQVWWRRHCSEPVNLVSLKVGPELPSLWFCRPWGFICQTHHWRVRMKMRRELQH